MPNAAPPYVQVPLSAFLGLYTEASDVDLPEGASPRCNDVDFIIGSVLMRPGLLNAFSFQGGGIGPNLCQAGIDVPSGGVPWSNPSNITLNDGSHATITPVTSGNPALYCGAGSDNGGAHPWASPTNIQGPPDGAFTTVTLACPAGAALTSNALNAINYGFALPPTSVQGIQVTLIGLQSLAFGFHSGSAMCDVQLQNGGTILGTLKQILLPIGASASVVLGGSTDDWSAGLTQAIANSPSFGLFIRVFVNCSGVPAKTVTFSLDAAQIELFYSSTNSDGLVAKTFGFAVPNLPINGIEITMVGRQTLPGTIHAQLLNGLGNLTGMPKVTALPIGVTDSTINLGGSSDTWGTNLGFTDINSTNFGVQIVASAFGGTEFLVDSVTCTIFTVMGKFNFNWVKTFAMRNQQVSTLALDADGTLWQENVNSNPGQLVSFYSLIQPNTFAKSVTLDDVEYMALSDLDAGTDMPRQWNGQWLDRISQVGPGAPPAVSVTSTTYPIKTSPLGITQPPATGDPTNPGHVSSFLWSAGPGSTATGNVITVYYATVTSLPNPDPNLIIGDAVVLAGFGAVNGNSPNGTYIINSVGSGIPPGVDHSRQYFTVTAQVATTGHAQNVPGTYQVTLATLTTTIPLPNTQVGSQITAAGVTNPSWDGSWTVLFTPNAAQLIITSTALSLNVATYTYTLVSGTAPVSGSQVTINGCLNGPIVGGTSIFNILNGIIDTAGAGIFTIAITGPNVASAAEIGNALVNGTIFQFDPGLSLVGSVTSPIFGNSGDGTVVVAGGNLGAGVRQAVVMFLTRNDYQTAPSIPVTFTTNSGATSLVFTNIPIGPPNVIARIIAITGANGSNFYWIPTPVLVVNGQQSTTYSATILNDNISTQATFTFTDAILLAASEIDIQGNNLFEQKELGPCIGTIAYAARQFCWGELNKITQFINPTFDGGSTLSQAGVPVPAGWVVDPTNGAGGTIVPSPLFGYSYYIQNTTGGEAAVVGRIQQSAYQDYYGVNIIQVNILYSVRLTARTPSSSINGTLSIQLFSPQLGILFALAQFPLAGMTSTMGIFTAPLLTIPLTKVPPDLLLIISLNDSTNNSDVELDRLDIFPTLQPVLTTQLIGSYVNNFEAFDQVEGNLDTLIENQQAQRAAFTQYGNLYMVKTGSLLETRDNQTTEPAGWSIRTISNSVGTESVNGVDFVDSNKQGESYALIAGRTGLYIFNGGEPVQLSGDIRSLWNLGIHWDKCWVRNDVVNRRILVGMCLPTPCQWLPRAPSNGNPTTPNVVLAMSYREVNSVSELMDRATVRASSFTGKLIAVDISRKWSIWQIQAPYTDFVTRPGGGAPLFLGNSQATGKIYQLTEGLTNDDGNPINQNYCTYGFVTTDTAQALQLANTRKYFGYATAVIDGSGSLAVTVYPENLAFKYPQPLIPYTIPDAAGFDLEMGTIDAEATRLFFEFSMNAVGQSFNLSRLNVAIRQAVSTLVRNR